MSDATGDSDTVDSNAVQQARVVHPLSYRPAGARSEAAGLVTVGSLLGGDTARLVVAVLEAEGIECHLFNETSQSLGVGVFGYTACQIQVPSGDADHAREIVRQLVEDPDAIEPAPEDDVTATPKGDDGGELVTVGAYDHPRSLQEAAAVLGSARIKPYLPRLVARGAGPPGTGLRFLLRAEAGEADRARSILDDAREEAEEDARERGLIRCPRCNRLTGERISRPWQRLIAIITLRPVPPPQAHCAPCRYYWDLNDQVT